MGSIDNGQAGAMTEAAGGTFAPPVAPGG
jgi:hypothetical protein